MATKEDGTLWVSQGDAPYVRVTTVPHAMKQLKKTRRQIYRYIQSGILSHHGKILGEWILDFNSVLKLAGTPLQAQPLPKHLNPLFPEYHQIRLNVGMDSSIIIGRILEYGSTNELQWLNKRYTRGDIKTFIQKDGFRLLTPRSLNFWSLFYKTAAKKVSWRENKGTWGS